MNPSTLFPLLSFALSFAISSSYELSSTATRLGSNNTASPDHKKGRELYDTETIKLNQEPCADMSVVVEEITDEPTYNPTSPPTRSPVPETTTTTSTTTTSTTTTTTTELETTATQSPNVRTLKMKDVWEILSL